MFLVYSVHTLLQSVCDLDLFSSFVLAVCETYCHTTQDIVELEHAIRMLLPQFIQQRNKEIKQNRKTSSNKGMEWGLGQ